MAERIIPITMEEENEEQSSPSDSEQKIAKPMEQLSIKTNKPTVQVKTIQKTNVHEEYLREFDVFEDRNESSIPNANVPEKLILVIDRAQDENFTPFVANNSKFTPLSMLKRAIQLFIKLKHTINKSNEFAIVVLNENNAKWILNFTSDMRKLKDAINKIDKCEVEDTFNLNSLFDEIKENVTMPNLLKLEVPPSYIVRTVIFYGRSYTIPKIQLNESIENLLENPYFICDVLITHEPVESSNYCHKIFNALQELDKKGLAYFFPVCRDSRRLHNCAAKLLGHPLQRPKQKLQKT
ncbi:BRISC and BRCA1-A complex member 1 [Anoplophora glabripennis]|nr:BRISC and BRCA1-A complex member 1 [Anoplophora glabripennis]